jgi:hypothetical protein
VKGKEEEEELEGKATVDGGRRYTATQTGAGRPDRSFVTGGTDKKKQLELQTYRIYYLQTKSCSVPEDC